MKYILLFVTSIVLFGCMTTVETRPEVIASAKSFTPAPDKAVVYAIRDTRSFPNESISAYIQDTTDESGYAKPITLLPRSFGRTEVAPGNYRVYANTMTYSMFDSVPESEVRMEAGEVYVYRLTPEGSWSGTVFFMDKLTKEQASQLIEKNQLSYVKN